MADALMRIWAMPSRFALRTSSLVTIVSRTICSSPSFVAALTTLSQSPDSIDARMSRTSRATLIMAAILARDPSWTTLPRLLLLLLPALPLTLAAALAEEVLDA